MKIAIVAFLALGCSSANFDLAGGDDDAGDDVATETNDPADVVDDLGSSSSDTSTTKDTRDTSPGETRDSHVDAGDVVVDDTTPATDSSSSDTTPPPVCSVNCGDALHVCCGSSVCVAGAYCIDNGAGLCNDGVHDCGGPGTGYRCVTDGGVGRCAEPCAGAGATCRTGETCAYGAEGWFCVPTVTP